MNECMLNFLSVCMGTRFYEKWDMVEPRKHGSQQIGEHEKWLNHVYGLTFISLLIKSGLWIFVVTELSVQCTFYGLVIFNMHVMKSPELKILELDTLNTDSLNLNIHCGHLWFLLNPVFFPLFGYPFRIFSLNGAQNFKFPIFWLANLIGWIFYTFLDTNYRF